MLHMGHYLIVAHTTHLPWAKFFAFDTSIGRDVDYNGKGVPYSTFHQKLTGSNIVYGTHMTTSILSWRKFYKISIKGRVFFILLPFSTLLLMANQGSNWTSKVSSMLRKLLMLCTGQKLAKTKTIDTLHYKFCSYCWG